MRFTCAITLLILILTVIFPWHGFAQKSVAVATAGGIDTHMHLGGLGKSGANGKGPGSGKPPGMGPAGMLGERQKIYDAAANHLVTMMDAKGIAKALVVTVPGKRPGESQLPMANQGEREYIIAAVKRHSGRLFLMDGGANLKPVIAQTSAESVTDAVRADFTAKALAVLDNGAVGFGEMIALHFCLGPNHSYQFTPADHPLFLALADTAAERNVPIDIHMEALPTAVATPSSLRRACAQNPATLPASIPAFERLLAHNRQARIVWQHIGWDNYGLMTTELLRELLAKHANLFLALRVERRDFKVGSPGEAMPNRIVHADGNIKFEWLALMREFPDRFMIGSDEFVGSEGGLTTEPLASFDETWAMFEKLPEELKKNIGGGNARAVYGLK